MNGLQNIIRPGLTSGLSVGLEEGLFDGLYGEPNVKPLLLDKFPNAAAAYSLRKLRLAYNGPCIRIRKINDNQEIDIGFVNNYLDLSSIYYFIGNNEARVTTWYDQSINNRNATQTTGINQPYISVTGGIITTMTAETSFKYKGLVINTGQRLISNFNTIPQPISIFSYTRKDNTTTENAGVIYDSYNNTQCVLYYTGTTEATNNRWSIASGASLQGTTSGNTNPNLITTLHNGASSNININSQNYVSGNAGTNGLNGLSIGNIRGNPNPIVGGYVLGGRIGELIIYGVNQTSNRLAIESDINNYYKIY